MVNVTSTNATTTNFYATNATIASINFTNVTTTNLSVTNINGNLIPLANNAFDIGTSTKSWRDVYASGTLRVGTAVIVAGSSAVTSTFAAAVSSTRFIVNSGDVNNPGFSFGSGASGYGIYAPVANYSVGITTAGVQRFKCDVGDCTVAQTLYVAGNALPNINNTKDLGSMSVSWRDVYASGTSYLAGIIAGNVTSTNTTSTNLFFHLRFRLLPSAQLTHSRKSIRLSRQRHELSCGRDRRHQLDV